MLKAGDLMIRRSPKAAFLPDYKLEQENLARRGIQEFLARGILRATSLARLPSFFWSEDWYPDYLAILAGGANVA